MHGGDGQTERLPRSLVLLLAVATGASVANLYYAQPLLHAIAQTLGISASTAALLVTASQIGYAGGLVLLVPLGDLLDRRRLVRRMLVVCAVALVVCAAAPSLPLLAVGIGITGVTSTVAQVLVPFASTLASEEERGRVVGQVMSGLLLGILLARTVSGLVTALIGWRGIFALAAAAMIGLAVALSRLLPDVPPAGELTYGQTLASVVRLVRTEPLLRRRMLYGGLGMGTFTVVWTSLALLLSRPPFEFSEGVIGLFGLAGVAGAVSAQFAGRAADAGGARGSTGLFLLAVLGGWGVLALGSSDVVAIVAGLVVLDLGIQGQHILNQTLILGIDPSARSRLTTAYMTSNFLCAAVSSAAATVAWSTGGWGAVCGLGATLASASLFVWVTEHLRRPAVLLAESRS